MGRHFPDLSKSLAQKRLEPAALADWTGYYVDTAGFDEQESLLPCVAGCRFLHRFLNRCFGFKFPQLAMMTIEFESGRAMADMTAFHQIARALTSSLDLESILITIMRQMDGFFHPGTWTLLLADEQRKDLYCVIADGHLSRELSEIRIPLGKGVAGEVAERGEAVILPNVGPSNVAMAALEREVDFEVHSAVCIPLRSRQKTLGVIELFNLPAESFSEQSISTLMVLSDFAAIAIENARTFQRVQELTITDECTGLYNRRHFDDALRHEIARCERFSTPMSLVFIDLDHFKLVNDRYGHQVGSNLLARVSATLKAQVRTIDLCFRYGGDEFVVLLPGTDKRTAARVANRLLLTLRQTSFPIAAAAGLNIRASLGISSYPEDGASGQEVLHAADARMYHVKETTRDGVCYFADDLRPQRRPGAVAPSIDPPSKPC